MSAGSRAFVLIVATLVTIIGCAGQDTSATGSSNSTLPQNPSFDDMVDILSHPVPPPAAGVTRGIRPAISLYITFQTGAADLTPDAHRTLDDLARALNAPGIAGSRFRIEGHTDTVGNRAANRALSERRASRVVDYLVTVDRIDRRRLDAVGLGSDALAIQTPDQTPEPRNRFVGVVKLAN